MIDLSFSNATDGPLKLMLLGAHPDDIEIGCGATVLKMLDQYADLRIMWVVLSGNNSRKAEARMSADIFLRNATEGRVELVSFKDGYFPQEYGAIKDYFEQKLKPFDPSIIFTHYGGDKHQDHRLVSDLTRQTFRNHLILEYEILKYDGDLGQPNVYFQVSKAYGNAKAKALMDCFKSQTDKHWFTKDTFRSMLRIRGVESASTTGLAEAFYGNTLRFK